MDDIHLQDLELSRDLEAGGLSGEENLVLREYFGDVRAIQERISAIQKNQALIQDKYCKLLASNTCEDSPNNEDLEEIITSTNAMAGEIRTRLKEMDGKTKTQIGVAKDTEIKIRRNLQAQLTKKFFDLMRDYQDLQTKYKDKYREKLSAQYRIVKPNASEEEIDGAIEVGNVKAFTTATLETKNSISYIQAKAQDVRRLEKSIVELHHMFIDLALMVESQQSLIDDIEHNCSQASTNTKLAVENLRKARNSTKRHRKRMVVLIIILLLVLLLLGGAGAIVGIVLHK